MISLSKTIRQVAHSVGQSWRELLLADITFKLFSFVVLTPLLGIFQRLTIWVSSDGLLSDADFVHLFTRPVGLLCTVLVASVWLAIQGLEQASLLAILGAKDEGKRISSFEAVRFAVSKAYRVLSVTGLLIAASLLIVLPIALIAFLVYRGLLGEFDVNYYLSEKPQEFRIAVGIGGLLAIAGVGSLLYLHSAWILALPITIFERLGARESLRASSEALSGKRTQVFGWIAAWLAFVILANALLAAATGLIGRVLIPSEIGSLVTLATRVGGLLIVVAIFTLLLNVLAVVTFAALMDTGYRVLRSRTCDIWSELMHAPEVKRFELILTRGRLAALLTVGTLLAAWIGITSLQAIPLTDHAVIMAHRGASAEAPENTMAAFQLAIDQGADWIEIDVQESADGQVIVMHDQDFMKQSRNPLKVWDSHKAQLADIDIGSWFDPQFSDQRVATLEEVLELCRDRVGVNIELKYYGHDQQLEQRVVEIIESLSMEDQIKLMSLQQAGVTKAKALRPAWECGLLLSVYAGDLNKIDVDFLAINSRFASRNFIRRAHAAGKEVYVWTVNDAASMSQMLNRGVDGLLTDRPELAKQVLAERAQMSLAERLISELSVWLLGVAEQPADSP